MSHVETEVLLVAGILAFYLLDSARLLHFDELQDQLYVLSSTNVQKWDAGAPMTARFKSKVFRAPRPANVGDA